MAREGLRDDTRMLVQEAGDLPSTRFWITGDPGRSQNLDAVHFLKKWKNTGHERDGGRPEGVYCRVWKIWRFPYVITPPRTAELRCSEKPKEKEKGRMKDRTGVELKRGCREERKEPRQKVYAGTGTKLM